MEEVVAYGHAALAAAHLPPALHDVCVKALRKPGRLFSDTPTCARMNLGWIEALAPERRTGLHAAVVAGDCMIAGHDLLDKTYDRDDLEEARLELLPGGVTLLGLSQELLRRADASAQHVLVGAALLAHGDRRAAAAHLVDYKQRGGHPADAATLLWITRQRSGWLMAASCAAMAAIAGGTWRQIGLAARFGRAYAGAAQLEDDLADRELDSSGGRQTLPTLLAAAAPGDVVAATTWVLVRSSLLVAAAALRRLEAGGTPGSTADLWHLLPGSMR